MEVSLLKQYSGPTGTFLSLQVFAIVSSADVSSLIELTIVQCVENAFSDTIITVHGTYQMSVKRNRYFLLLQDE